MVPRIWDETIDAHRRAVRDAVLQAAAALVAEHGLRSVTMAQIAERAGIGRATLYKYFPDVEGILREWHAEQITTHLEHLTAVRDQAGEADDRLSAVLEAYARIVHETREHGDTEHWALLHRDEKVAHAGRRLHVMIRDLLVEGADAGELRSDIAPDELAVYCRSALAAAREAPSEAAVRRLVAVTLDALRPRSPGAGT